jgi:hypothetical protein
LLFVGSTSHSAHTYPISLHQVLDAKRPYRAHLFDPARGVWVESEPAQGHLFHDLALRIDAQSYALVRFDGRDSPKS